MEDSNPIPTYWQVKLQLLGGNQFYVSMQAYDDQDKLIYEKPGYYILNAEDTLTAEIPSKIDMYLHPA